MAVRNRSLLLTLTALTSIAVVCVVPSIAGSEPRVATNVVPGGSAPSPASDVAVTTTAPKTPPRRECASAIFSGASASSIVQTPSDIVVGPARFGALGETVATTRLRSDRAPVFMKSPLSISGTDDQSITLRIATPDGSARLWYDGRSVGLAGTSAYRIEESPLLVELATAVPCGLGDQGFVQYSGGLVVTTPTCIAIEILDAAGGVLGSYRLPVGGASC